MENLIYLLPVLILFLVIFVKTINTFKKIFNFIKEKAAELEKDRQEDYSQKREYNYKKEQQEAQEEYKLSYEEELPTEESRQSETQKNSAAKKTDSKNKKKRKKDKSISKPKKEKVFLAEEFKDYSELEKAVIYKEILTEPKALQKRN